MKEDLCSYVSREERKEIRRKRKHMKNEFEDVRRFGKTRSIVCFVRESIGNILS
jgi:hypothetical protein